MAITPEIRRQFKKTSGKSVKDAHKDNLQYKGVSPRRLTEGEMGSGGERRNANLRNREYAEVRAELVERLSNIKTMIPQLRTSLIEYFDKIYERKDFEHEILQGCLYNIIESCERIDKYHKDVAGGRR